MAEACLIAGSPFVLIGRFPRCIWSLRHSATPYVSLLTEGARSSFYCCAVVAPVAMADSASQFDISVLSIQELHKLQDRIVRRMAYLRERRDQGTARSESETLMQIAAQPSEKACLPSTLGRGGYSLGYPSNLPPSTRRKRSRDFQCRQHPASLSW